jgi:hypothetical protein
MSFIQDCWRRVASQVQEVSYPSCPEIGGMAKEGGVLVIGGIAERCLHASSSETRDMVALHVPSCLHYS